MYMLYLNCFTSGERKASGRTMVLEGWKRENNIIFYYRTLSQWVHKIVAGPVKNCATY